MVLRRAAGVSRTAWTQLSQTRTMAAGAADADPFMAIFKKQQQTYRALLDKTKELPIPDKNDDKGIKEFGEKLAAIRKELGLYWTPENYKGQVQTQMERIKSECDGTMRDFLSKSASMGVDPSVTSGLLSALDGIEAKLGRPMLASDDKEGEPLFKAAVAEVKKEHGFDKMGAKEQLAAGDLETAETIVKDLQEMSAKEFFETYTPAK